MLECTIRSEEAGLQTFQLSSSAFTESQWVKILSTRSLESLPRSRLRQSFLEGIPSSLRGDIWSYITKSDSVTRSFGQHSFELSVSNASPNDAFMIQKDIARTYPELLDTPEIRLKLERILKAYAGLDKDVGYCQGMAFIAATLLIIEQDELKAFSTFLQVMRDKNWREVYTAGTPRLMKLLEQTYGAVSHFMPALHAHTQIMNLDGCFSQFFLTVFMNALPWEASLRVFDMFLLEGGDFLVSLLIKMLQLYQYQLLEMDEEKLFEYLKHNLAKDCFDKFPPTTLMAPSSEVEDEFADIVIF